MNQRAIVSLGVLLVLTASAGRTEDTGQKNATSGVQPAPSFDGADSWLPGPSSKNFDGPEAAATGESRPEMPGKGSKNASTPSRTQKVSNQEMPEGTVSAGINGCGSSGNLDWMTTSGTFQIVRECKLDVASDGLLFISANGSLFNSNGEYEAQFRIDIDEAVGDPNIDRWVNVYDDAGDGSDRSVALSTVRPISAGEHTIYLLAKRYGGPGEVAIHDPTLSAIFAPSSQTCGASGNLVWATTSSSFQIIRQCSLTVPSAGFLLISADGSLRNYNGEYEGQFEIDIDSTAGDPDIDRWLNIYNDSVDGSDESVALTVRRPVTAGTHTVYLLGKRNAGPGQVRVLDPTLTATFVPAERSCGVYGNAIWTSGASANTVIRQCTIDLPQSGSVFIAADGSLFNASGEYESHFQIGIDSTVGDTGVDRWVDIYDDDGDGTDRSVALTVLENLSAGNHTIYFLGRRSAGTGDVGVYDATLSVWSVSTLIFADDFESADTSAWAQRQP